MRLKLVFCLSFEMKIQIKIMACLEILILTKLKLLICWERFFFSWSYHIDNLVIFLVGIFAKFVYNLVLLCVAASMARKIYLRGGIGVGAFRRIYGGSKRNGSRPPHFGKSSGSVARHILQQLQTMSIIDIDTSG